jgi:hypothetical protein
MNKTLRRASVLALRTVARICADCANQIDQTPNPRALARLTHYQSDKRVLAIRHFMMLIEPHWYDGQVKAWEVPSIRMVIDKSGGVLDKACHIYVIGWLAECGVVAKRERHTTRWVGEWNPRRVSRYLKLMQFPHPLPEADPPAAFFVREQITDRTDTRRVTVAHHIGELE